MNAKVRLNHMSVQVRNLARSVDFYQGVLDLPEIECGAARPNIRWFGLGDGQSVHLIEGDFGATYTTRSTHFCISTQDLNGMIERLGRLSVPFCNVQGEPNKVHVRADGVHSVYLQDPDGHWIEINEDF